MKIKKEMLSFYKHIVNYRSRSGKITIFISMYIQFLADVKILYSTVFPRLSWKYVT